MAVRDWVILVFVLVNMTGTLGTMLVPLVMGMAAIPAYLLYRFIYMR
jgi:hypothetical protein